MNDWHYPRADLAKKYLGMLELDITSSIGLIASRRKGKTEFLLQDLALLAVQSGYLPVYASLWQTINAPHKGISQALEETIEATKRKSKVKGLLQSKITKAGVSNELFGSATIEFANDPQKPASDELIRLEELLTTLEASAKGKTIILLIDEAQHLATSTEFEPLAYALRTMLDKRQGRVKSVFTGSSRHYMGQLLNQSKSAFFHFVDVIDFPDMDEGFISFVRERLAKSHNRPVAIQHLSRAFAELDHSPFWLMKLVRHMITNERTVGQSLAYTLEILSEAEGIEEKAKNMRALDKIVFLAVADDGSPFRQEVLETIEKETSVKGLKSNVQKALRRLSEAGLVSHMTRGTYIIEKPGLRRYLLSQQKSKL